MIPKSTLGRGNRHKCFKIFDEYCSCLVTLVAWLPWLPGCLLPVEVLNHVSVKFDCFFQVIKTWGVCKVA